MSEANVQSGHLNEVRRDTRALRKRLRDQVVRLRESGLNVNSRHHPLTVADGAELAELIDQVMAILAWHHHDEHAMVALTPHLDLS